jgi:outer membrane lipopolysaccharide assembly protein LptE/RlpB
LAQFAKTITPQQAKRAALLTSSGGKVGKQQEVRETLEANGVDVIEEEFTCQGGFLSVGIGRPNAEDIGNAVAFAKRTTKEA